jgi:pimeloyl-ACP methyl ester carboxylesterase
VFEKYLGQKYTLYAFDFFYHGVNRSATDEQIPPFMAADLVQMLEKLMWENKKVKCSMMGYSLGGKLILGLIHRLPHRINELFLIAPDGLSFNLAHRLVARTWVGRALGSYFVNHPATVQLLINLSEKARFISNKTNRFLQENIRDRDHRLRVYRTWITLQKYFPRKKFYLHYLHTRPIRLELFFGKYDQIIPVKQGQQLAAKFRSRKCLHVLDAGHALLLKAEEISAIILKK